MSDSIADSGLSPRQDSHVRGPTEIPLRAATIGDALDQTVRAFGSREALVVRHQGIRLTWRELGLKVDAVAEGLLALGLKAGDRVGIWAPNCMEWVITQLASAKAGLILATINPAYRASEFEHALQLAGCRALVLADRYKTSNYLSMLTTLAPELAVDVRPPLRLPRFPMLEFVIQIGRPIHRSVLVFDKLDSVDEVERHTGSAPIDPDDPINIQFTSGTTGAPKGATLTHRNILNNGFFVGELMGITEEDRICIPVPLYHCFGMVMGVLNCVTHGAAMVFPGDAFEPRVVLEAVEAERCTALYGVPTMFVAELAHAEFKRFDLTSLRTGIMAGAPCPIEVMKRVISDMHMDEVTICYGMTETSPVSFQTRRDADLETRVSTVGTIHPWVEVKIVDDTGRTVPRGQTGELLTRGYSVMAGYWNDPERTADAIDIDGWMHTGDLGTIDRQGRCKIVGRAKDMIIRGGENIYPAEIENFLLTHPEVMEAAVFGLPDSKFGEIVCAWLRVSGTTTEQEIIAYCQEGIAHYKVPLWVRFVPEFPMTVTGKVQKFAMRKAMCEELGLQDGDTA